uniref:Uncharacterized protein n=1 Tax=uncultured prokaryote TaxID=198431 RepID=A0A0H5Q6B0_9ZZZZ|nr:hypothetical protein [uncultured prokaryote]
MTEREMLQAILDKVNSIDERLEAVEEDTRITREAVNALVEWADQVAVITQVRFPVKKSEKNAEKKAL